MWLGATVVNQEEADRDIPKLIALPARVRFLSMEPLLGPVSLDWALATGNLHWVIVGGESGPGARPMREDWALAIRKQCDYANVQFFMKQMGGVRDKRGELRSMPLFLQVREVPK